MVLRGKIHMASYQLQVPKIPLSQVLAEKRHNVLWYSLQRSHLAFTMAQSSRFLRFNLCHVSAVRTECMGVPAMH